MDRLLSHIRPAMCWLLLGTFIVPSLPAAGAEQPGAKLPAAFSLAAAMEPQPVEQPQPGASAKDVPSDSGLHLVVISGQNGVNVLKKKITVRPVVQVLDGKNHPVAGALVTFTAPASGPSVQFDEGTRTAMVVSGSDGRVSPTGVMAVNTGSFVYHIRAVYQEQQATETVAQTNVANGSAAADPQTGQTTSTSTTGAVRDHRFPGWAYAALIGGAAAGIGIGVALATKQSGKTSASTSTATVGAPGTPTVSAP